MQRHLGKERGAFPGVLLQVSPNFLSSGSSEKIRTKFRVDGQLGVHVPRADQTLHEWNSRGVEKFFGQLHASSGN